MGSSANIRHIHYLDPRLEMARACMRDWPSGTLAGASSVVEVSLTLKRMRALIWIAGLTGLILSLVLFSGAPRVRTASLQPNFCAGL